MLFLVQRPTPGKKLSRNPRSFHQRLPFEVVVHDIPEVRNRRYASTCACKEVWRLTDDAMARAVRLELVDLRRTFRSNACICACMGVVVG
jgi:hypothetical protein